LTPVRRSKRIADKTPQKPTLNFDKPKGIEVDLEDIISGGLTEQIELLENDALIAQDNDGIITGLRNTPIRNTPHQTHSCV
jgi:hypothetical protein